MPDKIQILVAEDDEQVRESLVSHLSEIGYNISSAASGNEAIPLLYGKEFNVVVLDLKMPYIDGFEVLKLIKSSFLKTKVIILTAYGDLKNITRCKELGADEVIEKPYGLTDLFDTIEEVMKR